MFWLAAVGLAVAMSSLSAHRQDECLQAAFIDVGEQQVRVFLSITPGTEVASRFRAVLDTDGDGVSDGVEAHQGSFPNDPSDGGQNPGPPINPSCNE